MTTFEWRDRNLHHLHPRAFASWITESCTSKIAPRRLIYIKPAVSLLTLQIVPYLKTLSGRWRIRRIVKPWNKNKSKWLKEPQLTYRSFPPGLPRYCPVEISRRGLHEFTKHGTVAVVDGRRVGACREYLIVVTTCVRPCWWVVSISRETAHERIFKVTNSDLRCRTWSRKKPEFVKTDVTLR